MLYAEESNPVTVAANLMVMDADVDHMLTEARVEVLSAAEGDFLTISDKLEISRALVLASGCYFRSVHAGTYEVRASQLAQA